jgi:hypothetical protein
MDAWVSPERSVIDKTLWREAFSRYPLAFTSVNCCADESFQETAAEATA